MEEGGSKARTKLNVVVHTCNLSSQEVEAENRELKVTVNYVASSTCL